MRNTVRFLIGFAVVATAGCTVKVNGEVHKFGLSGEDEKKKAGETGAADTDALAAELAGGAAASGATQSFTLNPDYTPNPKILSNLVVTATESLDKAPHGVSRCNGYVGETPAAVVSLPSGLRKARISAPGAEVIVAEFGDRKYVCDETQTTNGVPSVMMDEWPSGEMRLFVGGRKDKTFKYEIRIEDEVRPVDILWKSKVKAIDLAELPKDPILISEITPALAAFKEPNGCSNSAFREVPDVAFELKRPLTDVTIEVRSAKPVNVMLVGPLTETGRDIRRNCFNDDRSTMNRMEAGMYGLKIGTESPGAQVLYHVVVRGKDTSRNPVQAPLKFAEIIDLKESVITWHYPQLNTDDLEKSDPNRESLFLSAPGALFVFPKFNLDKTVADAVGFTDITGNRDEKSTNTPKDAKPLPAADYPKENEPLLLLKDNGAVMAADGSVFKVDMKDLAADPGGAIAIPTVARNASISFNRSLELKGPEDAKAIATFEKAQKDFEACQNRINNAASAKIDSIRATGYWRTQGSQIDAVNDAADRQIESSCRPKDLEKKKEALWAELAKTRTARRTASLAKIKPRLEATIKK